MQSKTSAYIDGKGNCFCRKCKAEDITQVKKSDSGFDSLFYPGTPWTKNGIIANMKA